MWQLSLQVCFSLLCDNRLFTNSLIFLKAKTKEFLELKERTRSLRQTILNLNSTSIIYCVSLGKVDMPFWASISSSIKMGMITFSTSQGNYED